MRETTIRKTTRYRGRVLDLEVQTVRLADGHRALREIVRHAPAVGVLARDADGRFLLVRQFRKAVESPVVEICAGICEPGERAAAAARRELREETGRRARRLVRLGGVYASPGYCDEWIDLYFADCAPGRAAMDLDEDERVEVVSLTSADLDRRIRRGDIVDGKTVAAWGLWRGRRTRE